MNFPLSDRSKTLLSALVQNESFVNSTLFYGPKGAFLEIGAAYFVLSHFCESATEKPCMTCSQCQQILSGKQPDVLFYQFEGAIKIEMVRDLQDRIKYGPTQSDRLFVIISDIDKMTTQGSNALLKTLEEPPQSTHFILLTHKLSSLLPTIRSRSQEIDFPSGRIHSLEEISSFLSMSELWFGSVLKELETQQGYQQDLDGQSLGLSQVLRLSLTDKIGLSEQLAKDKGKLLLLIPHWIEEWKYEASLQDQYQDLPDKLLTLYERMETSNVNVRLQLEGLMVSLSA